MLFLILDIKIIFYDTYFMRLFYPTLHINLAYNFNKIYILIGFYIMQIKSVITLALQVTEVPKMVEDSRLSFKLRRTSFLRDSNFNYNNNDVVDV